MLRFLPSRRAVLGLCLVLCVAACSAGTTKDTNRDLGGGQREAGQDEEDASEPDAEPGDQDAEPGDQDAEADAESEAPDAGGEGGSADQPDATLEAGANMDASATPDAAPDAASEGGANDAGADAGPLNVIYASFGTTLVRIDPDTAALTEVGTLRNAADAGQTYADTVMTWSGSGDSALMVTSYFVAPTLATVDLCTGLVRLGPAFSRAASPNLVVEGLALHPNGTLYVTSGNPANPGNSPISTNLGSVVRETGAITDIGVAVAGLQLDMDMLFVRGQTLYGVDVVTNNSRLGLFTFNLETGKDTQVVAPSYGGPTLVPLRVAYDASRDKAFAWRPSDRNLVAFDLVTGAATPIGETHAAGAYGGAPTRGFFVAPAPACPSLGM
jgi:hypothetical protein